MDIAEIWHFRAALNAVRCRTWIAIGDSLARRTSSPDCPSKGWTWWRFGARAPVLADAVPSDVTLCCFTHGSRIGTSDKSLQ